METPLLHSHEGRATLRVRRSPGLLEEIRLQGMSIQAQSSVQKPAGGVAELELGLVVVDDRVEECSLGDLESLDRLQDFNW